MSTRRRVKSTGSEDKACIESVLKAVSLNLLPQAFNGFEDEICEGAVRARDLEAFRGDYREWTKWLGWASVVLDENDYLKAAVYALNLAPRLAGTDYGLSRQRDLGQVWTDTIRGLLGEIALAKWLWERFQIHAELDYRLGPLKEFLPSDIKAVNGRKPNLNVSVKTTKLSGIWLDVPGDQIEHSDVFILVRVGVTREHFVSFLKEISVVRDKLIKEAVERKLVEEAEMVQIWSAVPEFKAIPAYIAGFLDKAEIQDKLKDKTAIIDADGTVKTKNVIINKYLGYWNEETSEEKLKRLLMNKGKPIKDGMKIEFEGIERFSRKTLHFIANSGFLKKKKEDWEHLISRL
ncbi:MAG: hypothetical protein RXQ94_02225 [Caldivirga sp.]